VRFLSANVGSTRWSAQEADAVPLFSAGDIGELSCRFNPAFDRYFMTYNSSNPRGIILRHAAQPWGPWSGAIRIFEPESQGLGKFMHIPWNVSKVDHVQDDMWLVGRRDNEWGGEYGPYQIERFSTGTALTGCSLYYTLSSWNPYSVHLMRTQLSAADLGL
jgi:hypothetical protein